MERVKWWSRLVSRGAFVALLTLAVSGVFKVAAFAREAFIASHFGLSPFTDAYFGFQQLPTLLMSFMFGAFALAFAPAVSAAKRKSSTVEWLPGLLLYGTAVGLLLTAGCAISSALLLNALTSTPTPDGRATLLILCFSFCPVIWLGVWTGVMIASGRNLAAMLVAGLPYFLMTVFLVLLYAIGRLTPLSLPASFLAGLALVGLYALIDLIKDSGSRVSVPATLKVWRNNDFRTFLSHLAGSSFENLGYSINQLLLLFFLARAGSGAVSASACAMRVGMLGLTLLGQPLAQLVQAKLCAATEPQQPRLFRKWLLWVAGAVVLFALVMFSARSPVTSFVYLRGKFSSIQLNSVLEIVPAWICYFVVNSLNALAARYLFVSQRGKLYVRHQWLAYSVANLARFTLWGRIDAPGVIWCSVIAEGLALGANLRCCFHEPGRAPITTVLAVQEVKA